MPKLPTESQIESGFSVRQIAILILINPNVIKDVSATSHVLPCSIYQVLNINSIKKCKNKF